MLTYRVVYPVHGSDVAPWHIMAVTFANKAARELKERLSPGGDAAPQRRPLLTPRQMEGLSVGTCHATCAHLAS